VQFSTIDVLVPMPMTRWEFRIVTCLAGGIVSATCLKMQVIRFADVQKRMTSASEFASAFLGANKFLAIILLMKLNNV